MADSEKYSVFYTMELYFVINGTDIVRIDHDDIVSFTVSNQYDTMTYPMIRLRLYSDLSVLQSLADSPDAIRLRGSINSMLYEVSDKDSPKPVSAISEGLSVDLKVYMEMKNIASSKMDKYSAGLPRSIDDILNVTNKVPIEVFLYDDKLVHAMKDQAQAVFKGMTIGTALNAMMDHANIRNASVVPFHNQTRFDQILIPNLSIIDAVSFFDTVYGLYPKGGMMFGDTLSNHLYICNLDSDYQIFGFPLSIYVNAADNNNDNSGMMSVPSGRNPLFSLRTSFENVSILTESDIEKVLRAERITSVNVETLDSSTTNLPFYTESETSVSNTLVTKQANDNISPTLLLHKSTNPYVATMSAARIEETVTRIDVSGTGWEVFELINPATRINLVFESPLRGVNMAANYRISFANHVLTNVGNSMFVATTTMTLCKN